eukprot:2361432-Pleurochrysis_carterae.AAC.6
MNEGYSAAPRMEDCNKKGEEGGEQESEEEGEQGGLEEAPSASTKSREERGDLREASALDAELGDRVLASDLPRETEAALATALLSEVGDEVELERLEGGPPPDPLPYLTHARRALSLH